MDFALSAEQQALAESVERFCARDYHFAARKAILASPEGFSRTHFATFAALGWLGAGVPVTLGGIGGGAVETAIIMERFGRALVVEPFLPVAVLALQTLSACAASAARDRLIAALIAGEKLAVLAHNEPEARGDPAHVTTRALPTATGWRLTGYKSLVPVLGSADLLLVSALADGGIGLFAVSPKAPGLRLQPYRTLDHHRSGDIGLDGVPAEGVLAAPGSALPALETGMAHALTAVCAEAVGAMDAALRLTRDYLTTRRQFNTTLNSFQALQHRMADMLMEIEMSRSILYQGLSVLDGTAEQRRRGLSAMKAVVSRAALFVGREAIQLHGGIGMTEDYAIGHYYRRLFVIAQQFGNENDHLKRLAATLIPFWPLAFGAQSDPRR